METIHFKTIDPVSQELLSGAARKGLDLNWERYEKQQPQDGFLRLGLSCPYGCMQGPCRIDPFERGASHGICGLTRDGMAAAMFLRLTLQGALEAMSESGEGLSQDGITWPEPLSGLGTAAVKEFGEAPLSSQEIFQSAAMLARPSASPGELIRQALRLGLLVVNLTGQAKGKGPQRAEGYRVGYGLLAGEAFFIGLAGRISSEFALALAKETAGYKDPEVRLVTLGDWIPAGESFLPLVGTTGEGEAILSSGKLRLLVAGPQADPGLIALSERMKIPVLQEAAGTVEVLNSLKEAVRQPALSSFNPDAALIGEGRVLSRAHEMENIIKKDSPKKFALIGGADSLQQSLGHLPVELARALLTEDYRIFSWGDAALWLTKQDLPVGVISPEDGPLAALKHLAAAGRLPALQGICFTGLLNCREFSLLLGLTALGMRVAVATPLPLWGSEQVRLLLRECLAKTGGSLTHFNHPAKAEEILGWFLRD